MLFRLANISKSFGGTEVLRNVSFQVNAAEKVGLVGRNGAGKTTLLKILTGQEGADTGEVIRMSGLRLGLLEQHVDFEVHETVHSAALSSFREVQHIEEQMREAERQMETDHSDAILERYADLQLSFEIADGFTYAARAEAVLLGLGFRREAWSHPAQKLSGGQKNRLAMVRLLLSNADVLLLDEPTNHLDVDAVEWLEGFLDDYDGSYLIISHDRYFLDRTTNRIIEIDRGEAYTYKGNYSAYLEERELRREQQQREYENQQAFINKTQEFIRRNLEGQKTKQAKSRRTMLARLERIDAVQSDKGGGNFDLKAVERAANNVLTLEGLSIGYPERVLAEGIDLTLHRGDALGIIGSNGTGKTTLLRTLMGSLPALAGEIRWGTRTSFGYYSQNLDELELRNDLIQELRRVAPQDDNGKLRGFLARFLFMGDDVFKPVSALSGGEKGRLALAKLIYSRKNVLILDEPTNHLDIPSRESLENALQEYDGTIITVSHDRYFLDKIVNRMLAFEADGRVTTFDGNYTEFHERRTAGAVLAVRSDSPKQQVAVAAADNGSLSKNQRQTLEKRLAEIEQEIPEAEAAIARLAAEMSRSDVASDFTRLSAVTAEHGNVEKRVENLYKEWDEISERLR
jgi:ATP-binding cassette, subfamily F, member 3